MLHHPGPRGYWSHIILVLSDTSQLSGTAYSRNRFYVALSRARASLTLVVPDVAETPLAKIR